MSKDKQSIQVTIRVRPLSEKQKQQDPRICVGVEQHTHSIQTFYGNESKKFTFDSICDGNSQDDMFQKVGKRSTGYCLQGYNCTIFAYGQTGSGKTFTMMGVDPAHQHYDQLRGLIPRTLQYLFQSIDFQIKQTSSQYIIRCSFLEIYNQQIIDLLNPRNNNNLQVREDIKKGVYVEGITQQTIFKGDQAMDMLKKGSKGRHVGSTCYNETSSRSHSVFTMQIQSKHTKNGVVNTKIRYFHFIDLAGSQRTKQINGDRLKQGCSINKSLHVLGKVINSLAQSTQLKPRHINYRDSKLTFLLKDSLGGNSKTHLIANVSPCTMSYSQTNMTLAFARRVKLIKVNKASINQDMSGNLQGLKDEIKRLKQEIIALRNNSNGSVSTIMNVSSMLPKLDSSDELQQYSTTPNSLSPLKDSRQQAQHDTKILTMLNQYVSDQLDKQTKFSLQINKLYKKIQCLQQAIKKYSENEMHFKLIINVYQDKVARMRQGEALVVGKVGEGEGDQKEKIVEYFRQEREELVKEIDQYKLILSENSNVLLGLLKSCKAYNTQSSKQSQYKQQFLSLLKANTQFLTSLSTQVQQILHTTSHPKPFPSTLQSDLSTIDKLLQQRLALVQLQYSKKQSDFLQRIQQMGLQIVQIKNMNEDNQMLLREAVDREISLEESVREREKIIKQMEERNNELMKKEEEFVDRVGKAELTIDQLRRDNVKLKQQLQQQHTSYSQLQQSHSSTISQMQQLQQQLSQSTQQSLTLKQHSLQLQSQLSDTTSSYQQKLSLLQQRLQQSQSQLIQTQRKLLEVREEIKVKQGQYQQMRVKKKKQMEDCMTMIGELEHRLGRQEKELYLANQGKEKLQVKAKCLQQKITTLNSQLQHNLSHIDTLTLQLTHTKHQSQHNQTKLTHLQSLLHQKSLHQLQLQQKLKQKQSQLLQTLSQFQSSTDSSCQEINKVKIENLQLRQGRSELELKVGKLGEGVKEREVELEIRANKIQQLRQQLQQKASKLTTEKQLTTQQKQTIRHLTYLLEQHRLSITTKQLLITQKDQQFEQIHSKNISLLQQLAAIKTECTEHMLKLKEMQNQMYCAERKAQVERDGVVREYQRKMAKLNQMLAERSAEIKGNVKVIGELKIKLAGVEAELVKVKEMGCKAQQGLKLLIQKQIMNRSMQTTALKQQITSLTEEHAQQLLQSSSKITQLQQANCNLQTQITHLTSNHQHQQLQNSQLTIKIQQQQTHITQLQQKLQQLRNTHERQLVDLQQQHNHQIDSKNEEIEGMSQELRVMGQELEMKNVELEQRDKEVVRINQEMKGLRQQLNHTNQQLQHIRQLINTKDNTINTQSQQLQQKTSLLQQTHKQLQSKSTSLTHSMQRLQQKNLQIAQMKDLLMDREQGISVYMGEMQQLRKQLQMSRITIEELSNQLEEKQCEVEARGLELERQKVVSEQRVKELGQQITQLEMEVQELSAQLQQQMSTKQHNEQAIRTLTIHNRQLTQTLSAKQSQLLALKTQLSNQSNAFAEQLNQLKHSIQEKTALLQQVDAQLQELRVEKVGLERQYHEEISNCVEEREVVNGKVGQLEVALKQSLRDQVEKEDQLQQVQLKLQQLTSQLQQTTQQLQSTSRQLQQTSQQLQQATHTNAQQQTLISQLNTQLYQLQNTLTLSQQSHTSLSEQLHTITIIKDTQQQQIQMAVSRIHHLETRLQEETKLKQKAQSELEQAQKRWACEMEGVNSELSETIKQLQAAKQSLGQQTHTLKQQIQHLTSQLAHQSQSHQQQSQSLQLAITHLTEQKSQQLQSYRSLQQINNGLGRKCEQYVTSLQQQKSEYRKLQTKYLGERNINQNLKQLIQNNQQQKKRLSLQLRQKSQSYTKLLEKIKSQQYQQILLTNSRQTNQISQLKAKNQELKRVLINKTQLVEKKEGEMKELAKKSEEYSKSIQLRVKEFEGDYVLLEGKYEQLLESKKLYEATQQQNLQLRQQLQQSRPKLSRMTLKIQQLQQRIRSINQQYIQLQQQNHQIKKKILYPSTNNEQKVSMYLNKLKSEINDLKKEKQILEETIKKETAEKMRLKTELIKTNAINSTNNTSTTTSKHNPTQNPTTTTQPTSATKLQLQRKLTEIRYLQQIIAQMIDILKIKQFEHGTNPKSIKIQSIRKGIVTSIKEKIQENKMLKEKLMEMEGRVMVREKENKGGVGYNGVGSSSSATKKQPSSSSSSIIPTSHVTMSKTQKRDKTFSLKQQNQSSQNIKNRLNSTPNSQQCSQDKKQRRGITIGDNVRTMMDATQQMQYNVREKMRVKEIISNHNGKYYRNVQ